MSRGTGAGNACRCRYAARSTVVAHVRPSVALDDHAVAPCDDAAVPLGDDLVRAQRGPFTRGAPSSGRRRARPAAGRPNASLSISVRDRFGERAGREHVRRPSCTSACVNPGGTSSRWWVTSTSGGRVASPRPRREVAHELLAAADVEAGVRFVEQHDAGLVHQRAREQHPLALTGRQRGERCSASFSLWKCASSATRTVAVRVGVGVPPGRERGVLRGHHDLAGGHARFERRRERRRREGDRSRSVRTSHRPETAARAPRRFRATGAGTARRRAAASSCPRRSARPRPSARRRRPSSRRRRARSCRRARARRRPRRSAGVTTERCDPGGRCRCTARTVHMDRAVAENTVIDVFSRAPDRNGRVVAVVQAGRALACKQHRRRDEPAVREHDDRSTAIRVEQRRGRATHTRASKVRRLSPPGRHRIVGIRPSGHTVRGSRPTSARRTRPDAARSKSQSAMRRRAVANASPTMSAVSTARGRMLVSTTSGSSSCVARSRSRSAAACSTSEIVRVRGTHSAADDTVVVRTRRAVAHEDEPSAVARRRPSAGSVTADRAVLPRLASMDPREWLDSHINLETGAGVPASTRRPTAPTRERIDALLKYLGRPSSSSPPCTSPARTARRRPRG